MLCLTVPAVFNMIAKCNRAGSSNDRMLFYPFDMQNPTMGSVPDYAVLTSKSSQIIRKMPDRQLTMDGQCHIGRLISHLRNLHAVITTSEPLNRFSCQCAAGATVFSSTTPPSPTLSAYVHFLTFHCVICLCDLQVGFAAMSTENKKR